MSSPAFQFYPDDFLGSGKVGMMTPVEVGIYTLLLCLDWNEGGFELNHELLARWCRTDEGCFKGAWTMVGRCFVERDGRWFNQRLERERVKQAAWREKSRAGGLKSAAARTNATNHPSTTLQPSLVPNGNTPFPSPTPITTTTSSRPKREKADTSWLAPFCKSWESVNGAGSFAGVAGEAARALSPLIKNGHSPMDIVDHLDCYLDQTEAQFQSITRFAKTFAQWKPQPIIVDGEFTEYGERITRPAAMR